MSVHEKYVCHRCGQPDDGGGLYPHGKPMDFGVSVYTMHFHRTKSRCIAALRAALDQERADCERLRAFAQAVYDARDMDELGVWLPRALELHELMTNRHEPTALLSGRGEGQANG